MPEEGTSHGPIYITRGMKAMCDCGTAPKGNYLNIVVDHGVIVGPEQQPLLNANDHTTDTVIGFGNCKSGTNPKIQLQKGVMSFLLGGNPLAMVVTAVTGKGMGDILADIGLINCKCEPDTPQVWQNCDEEHILDGAPVLTKDSFLSCRNGGTITIMEEEGTPDGAQASEGEDPAETEEDENVVDNRAQEALAAAMAKINAAVPPSEAADSPAAVSSSGAGPAATTQTPAAAVNMLAMATMSTYPAITASRVMPALGLTDAPMKPLQMTAAQRAEEFMQNQTASLPPDALNEQGFITDMSQLGAFQMFQQPANLSASGAVAAYNAMKAVSPQTAPSFADIIFGMEEYGAVQSPNGVFSPGISDFLVKQGCSVQYLMPGEIAPAFQNSSVIGMSLNQSMMNYDAVGFNGSQEPMSQFALAVMPQQLEG